MSEKPEKKAAAQKVEEKKPATKKALVNMMLPSGTRLVMGQPIELKAEDEAHFKAHFKADDLKHIVAE